MPMKTKTCCTQVRFRQDPATSVQRLTPLVLLEALVLAATAAAQS